MARARLLQLMLIVFVAAGLAGCETITISEPNYSRPISGNDFDWLDQKRSP